jgi:hypothetical protein
MFTINLKLPTIYQHSLLSVGIEICHSFNDFFYNKKKNVS